MSKIALIAGSTGLIGKQLLSLLIGDSSYSQVISVSRRSTGISNSKLIEVITSFDDLNNVAAQLKADDIFICLGSTLKKAGSKELFKRYDYTYPFELAKLCFNNGAKQLSMVSAMGANSESTFFYSRVKGDLETSVINLGYATTNILRPSLLIGEREDERTMESMAQQFYKSLGWVFVGPAKKYKAIDGNIVASAMINIANSNLNGVTIFDSNEIETKG